LYQAEKGNPAEKLDDLVPGYLPSMPIEPFSGRPFQFRISKGEKIASGWFGGVSLAAGQALVWSEGMGSFRPAEARRPESRFLFPVPVWRAKK
jgi:hypothetical protein